MRRITRISTRLTASFVLALLAGAASAQVIEEEDLAEPDLATAPRVDEARADETLVSLFEEAEGTFFDSDDPALALESLTRVLETIERRRAAGELSATARGLLLRGLLYRAALRFELGDEEAMKADLGRLLELDPEAELDREVVSAEVVEAFAEIRRERVGQLRITAAPPDLELSIDGRAIALERPEAAGEASAEAPLGQLPGAAAAGESGPPETVVTLLAGIRLLEAERPGYAPLVQEVEIEAGQETPIEVALERTSAVIRLHTRPSDAEVTLDGVSYGVTSGVAPEDYLPATAGAPYRREEFSAELVVPDVELGLRVLEVKRAGFRPFRSELRITDLTDHPMPPIVLERERGTLALTGLPDDAALVLDGTAVRPENPGAAAARIAVAPGEHHLQVTQGRTRMFATRVRVADRQTVEINVRLRPGLAFLGTFGGAGEDLARALRRGLGDSPRWSLLDRSAEAREILPKAGFTVEAARRAAGGDAAAVDWSRVQTAADARAPGLLYVAVVLADDLLASAADVWIWAAAPGPARPDRLRLDLGQQAEIDRLRDSLHRTLALRRPWLGAQVITSDAAPHPVVTDVTPGGPLAATGIDPGAEIVAVSQVPVFSGADLDARLLAAETGETVEVGVRIGGVTESLRVTLGSSPLVHSQPTPGVPDAIAFTELLLLAEKARPQEMWVIRLNQALILLRARDHEGAVRLLRDLEAPQTEHGVGRATVDYWFGLALANSGSSYRDAAIEALRRAARVPGARLDHHDGPWLAPRARARLTALGADES